MCVVSYICGQAVTCVVGYICGRLRTCVVVTCVLHVHVKFYMRTCVVDYKCT